MVEALNKPKKQGIAKCPEEDRYLGERRGGRKKGTPNKATGAKAAAIAASGMTPLEFLVQQYRNEKLETITRIDAAKAAAPYVHPKLATNAGRPFRPLAPLIP